jgi:hypothetical protein
MTPILLVLPSCIRVPKLHAISVNIKIYYRTFHTILRMLMLNCVLIERTRMHKTKNFRDSSSAGELYRVSDRHLRRNLVPSFVKRGVSRGQRGGSPHGR